MDVADPTDPRDIQLRASTLLEQGDTAGAVALLDRALRSSSENLVLLDVLFHAEQKLRTIDPAEYLTTDGRFFPLFRDRYRAHHKIDARREYQAAPFYLQNIELTNRCPLKCVMCPRTHDMTREQGLMSFDLFKKIIDELAEADSPLAAHQDVALHHFGESLVHPEFCRFARYARSRDISASLSVNPIMLTPKISAQLLDSQLSTILMSLDGHDNESFEKIRGLKDAYDRSKENAVRFAAMKAELNPSTRLYLSMVNFAENRESIARMVEFWRAVPGIDGIRNKDFVSFDGSVDAVNALAPAPWNNSERRKRTGFAVCEKPWQVMSVTWDGEVVPCCYDYDKKYVLGNAGETTLSEIWNGEPMRRLRREFILNAVSNPLCANCEELYCPPSWKYASLGSGSQGTS
jgi:radical SAM protein with 4Fe4S-binding SPASM domain